MKTLEIKVDDWCLVCPNMELETKHILADRDPRYLVHQCKHAGFCGFVIAAYRHTRENGGADE